MSTQIENARFDQRQLFLPTRRNNSEVITPLTLTAHQMRYIDKIHYIKSFLPKFTL